MAWSPPAHNAGIVWVSAPGDYATFNSNHTPDGTSRCSSGLSSRNSAYRLPTLPFGEYRSVYTLTHRAPGPRRSAGVEITRTSEPNGRNRNGQSARLDTKFQAAKLWRGGQDVAQHRRWAPRSAWPLARGPREDTPKATSRVLGREGRMDLNDENNT